MEIKNGRRGNMRLKEEENVMMVLEMKENNVESEIWILLLQIWFKDQWVVIGFDDNIIHESNLSSDVC